MVKKASLSLSTNAIVVLIIAITILGLALAFTRNIFGTLGEHVSDIGASSMLENPPSFEDPMTLSKSIVKVRIGKEIKLMVGAYNKYNEDRLINLTPSSCTMRSEDTLNQFEFTIPGPRLIKINEDIAFSINIIANDKADLAITPQKEVAQAGTHVCTFKVIARIPGVPAEDELLYEDLYITVE
ncbi:MAG: hypothetical protein ABIG95_03230 [Candidatus Woesearchaeota archaeon]